MADNIEKSAADSMASSEKYGGFAKMRNLTNILMGRTRSTTDSDGGSSTGGSSTGGGGRTGNGWTAEDYKNYGDWQERHYGLHNDAEDKKVYREAKGLEARNDIEDIAKNRDLGREIQRRRLDSVGYGPGFQGTSQQQAKPGGRRSTTTAAPGTTAVKTTTTPVKKTRGKAVAQVDYRSNPTLDAKNREPNFGKVTPKDLTTTTVKPATTRKTRGKRA